MISDYDVVVEYRNKDMEVTGERRYQLTEYTDKISHDITKILYDVENAFKTAHGSDKSYNVRTDSEFNRIRKGLLNSANAVSRLPSHIRCNGDYIDDRSVANFIANLLDT